MQLTNYTDYALRTLIALGAAAPEKLTVSEIGEAYAISPHHLLKVVQRLASLGYVETLRGKSGGVRLAKEPREIRLGDVVRQMETELGVVGCLRTGEPHCAIVPVCKLKGLLQEGTRRFLSVLDDKTLADVVEPRLKVQRLLQLRA